MVGVNCKLECNRILASVIAYRQVCHDRATEEFAKINR